MDFWMHGWSVVAMWYSGALQGDGGVTGRDRRTVKFMQEKDKAGCHVDRHP